MQANIVRAAPDHLDDAWLLLNEYFQSVGVVARDDRESLHRYIAGEQSGFWLAYVGLQAAGCILLRPLRLASGHQPGEIKRLYVKPEFRSLGIAKRLLQSLEEFALQCGMTDLYLDTKDDLTAALQFYQRSGYLPCERYNDNPQATIFLHKALASHS